MLREKKKKSMLNSLLEFLSLFSAVVFCILDHFTLWSATLRSLLQSEISFPGKNALSKQYLASLSVKYFFDESRLQIINVRGFSIFLQKIAHLSSCLPFINSY